MIITLMMMGRKPPSVILGLVCTQHKVTTNSFKRQLTRFVLFPDYDNHGPKIIIKTSIKEGEEEDLDLTAVLVTINFWKLSFQLILSSLSGFTHPIISIISFDPDNINVFYINH